MRRKSGPTARRGQQQTDGTVEQGVVDVTKTWLTCCPHHRQELANPHIFVVESDFVAQMAARLQLAPWVEVARTAPRPGTPMLGAVGGAHAAMLALRSLFKLVLTGDAPLGEDPQPRARALQALLRQVWRLDAAAQCATACCILSNTKYASCVCAASQCDEVSCAATPCTVLLQGRLRARTSQIREDDLIGTSAAALTALQDAEKDAEDGVWRTAAFQTLDMFMYVFLLLDAARRLPNFDAAVADACWKRCGEVRLFHNIIAVRCLQPA